MIGSGESLAKMLRNQSANCKKCNNLITFEDGVRYAQSKGINDKVVMCKKCMSVFEVELTPAMILKQNVTSKYFSPNEVQRMLEGEKTVSKPISEPRLNDEGRYTSNNAGCIGLFSFLVIISIIGIGLGFYIVVG